MKKILFAALLGLVGIMSSCSNSKQKTYKEAVGLPEASVGDVVVFGDIRWYVIAKTETGCTLLSEKPVIKMPFNKAGYQVIGTWDKSTVRAWLNNQFYNTFTEEEKALITMTHNVNPANSEYGTPGGDDTDDYVFLLSVEEASALESTVLKCGYWYDMDNQWWWLRSPGMNKDYTAYVGNNSDGKNVADPMGDISGNEFGAVRPALNLSFTGQSVPAAYNRTAAEEENELAVISGSEIGDVVAFGRNTWYVADKTDGVCTLLSQGPVANMAYNDTETDITWENCTLRTWLNKDFFNSRFSEGERASVVVTHNTYAKEDSPYEMDCGNDTDDKVYLFTYTESKTVSDEIRQCGVDWWLRSPGKNQNCAVFILGRSANLMGNDVQYRMGVRPVIRVRYAEQTTGQ